jgi:transposase
MLPRRGWIWNGGKKAWGQGHRLWLRSLRSEQAADQAADQAVLEDYLQAIEQVEQRLRGLEQHIEAASQLPAYAEAVGAVRCCRGIDTLTAMRFDSARGLMAFFGLVPSEFSSADSETAGAITKAGNRHARRLLIEASWHYRHHPNAASLKRWRQGQPAEVVALADKAMYRLNRRFNRLLAKGKPRSKAVVAVARELVWAALHSKAA